MKQPISKSGVYAAASRTIQTRKPEVVALMQKYGMAVSETDSDGKIDKAFFALLPRSRGFRNDFSTLASEVASGMAVGELSMTGYLNANGKDFNETRLGQILSNDAIKNALNLGFSTLAYKATKGGVGGSTGDNILGSATLPPTPTALTTPPAPTTPPKKDEPKGTDLGWLLFVGIGVVVLGGGYLIYKSVKK